jgi:hypothetical protein
VRGTFSNTISAYCDCIRLPDPADPPALLNLLGGCLSDLPRPCSGLWVRDSLTVGVCDTPVFGVPVMLTSPGVIALGVVVESGGEDGVTLSAADIGATAWVFWVGEDVNKSGSNVELDKDD